jgi:hypothetical protein
MRGSFSINSLTFYIENRSVEIILHVSALVAINIVIDAVTNLFSSNKYQI